MKLVFPGGEHPQVLLGPGVSRIGSDPHANIVIDRPGVFEHRRYLLSADEGAVLQSEGKTLQIPARMEELELTSFSRRTVADFSDDDLVTAMFASPDAA